MDKRKRKKKFKKEVKSGIKIGMSLTQCDKCKQDSIAHKIKSYFEIDTITYRMLFKYDSERKKVLVSKRQLIYLMSLCNDVEQLQDYNMEIVDNIDIFK
jgi:hypothetical protein